MVQKCVWAFIVLQQIADVGGDVEEHVLLFKSESSLASVCSEASTVYEPGLAGSWEGR